MWVKGIPYQRSMGKMGTCLALVLTAGSAVAQQKDRVSFKAPAEDKYTQQQNIAVGDIPGHIVRSFEIYRTFPANNAPVINGIKLIAEWDRGIADYVDANGSGTVYSVYMMDDGDKFFDRTTLLVQTTSEKLVATNVGIITGGTGRFAGMQGIVRMSTTIDPKAGVSETETTIEYSVGK